jgi:hypothetical protein
MAKQIEINVIKSGQIVPIFIEDLIENNNIGFPHGNYMMNGNVIGSHEEYFYHSF